MQLVLATRRWNVSGLDARRLDHQHVLEGFTMNIVSEQAPTKDLSMQVYLPSTRELSGYHMPVLIKHGEIGGDWLPPARVYLAHDVDKELARLREQIRVLQLRDDYVTGCLV
jgi:hypothetical protein